MAKMIIMYEEPKDKEGFERHYFNVHVPLDKPPIITIVDYRVPVVI